MTDAEIVTALEHSVVAAAHQLARGYWAADVNRLAALRMALAAERRTA